MKEIQLIKEKLNTMIVSEDNYEVVMQETVIPYIDAIKETGTMQGIGGMPLYYEQYVNPDSIGTIVICHGMGENLEKYDEMIYYFLEHGYSVYGIEHRGHGRSGRFGVEETEVSVDSFDHYLSDYKTFLDEVVVPSSKENNLYLFAHSMGGGIGTRFLEKYPEYFHAAVLSAPMHGVKTGILPVWMAKFISNTMAKGKKGHNYALGNGPYKRPYNYVGCHARSKVRYARVWSLRNEKPELRMGGGSYRWVSECMNAVKTMLKQSEISKVKIPILLLEAGNDALVDNKGHKIFASRVKDCKVIHYPGSKHELYSEPNDVLLDYLANILAFLNNNK